MSLISAGSISLDSTFNMSKQDRKENTFEYRYVIAKKKVRWRKKKWSKKQQKTLLVGVK